MAWPLASEFSRVLQNPQIAFRDPELRLCRIETDRWGQPRPRSGNFATVYRAIRPDGSAVAVKVFNRQIEDRRKRYRLVSEHLARHPLPALVDFDYDERGIRAFDQHWYPLLAMHWVEGETLFDWLAEKCRLGDGAAIARAAEAWVGLTGDLARHSIVHGDLQPSNILVDADARLRLVDYDGMSVPGLLGQPSPEIGLAPYQHPGRVASTRMTPGMDHFSSVLIYAALRALALEPGLWTRYVVERNSDKLLFDDRDLAQGSASAIYRDLQNLNDAQTRELAQYFFSLAAGPLEKATSGGDLSVWGGLPAAVEPERREDCEHLERVFRQSPPTPTLGHDRLLAAAWSPEVAAAMPPSAPAVTACLEAEQRLASCEVLRKLSQERGCSLEREREILRRGGHLPDGYDPVLNERVRRARRRLTAHHKLRLAFKPPVSDLSIAAAWRAIERCGAEPLVGSHELQRIDLALARLPLLKALAEQISDVFPADDVENRLLKLWSEPLLDDCSDAAPWRARYDLARRRAGGASAAGSRIDEAIRRALIVANGLSRPPEPDENGWLAKRDALVESFGQAARPRSPDNFDVSLVRLLCRETPSLGGPFTKFLLEQIIPAVTRRLANPTAGAIVRQADGRCRIGWDWPPVGWLDACSVAIVRNPSSAAPPLAEARLWSALAPRGKAPRGELLSPAASEWRGASVVAWAHWDLGFKQFVSSPVVWGKIPG